MKRTLFEPEHEAYRESIRTFLENIAELLNASLWWVTVQTTLRIAFGLSLWSSFAFHDVLRRLLGAE